VNEQDTDCTGEVKNEYKILVRKPQRNRLLTAPTTKWENIETELRKIGYEDVDWIKVAHSRFCEHSNTPVVEFTVDDAPLSS
jgi:hypothetical protein